MNAYNIGVTQNETVGAGANLGFVIAAENADAAYIKVVNLCVAGDIELVAGHMSQRRSENNDWFDRTYPVCCTLL